MADDELSALRGAFERLAATQHDATAAVLAAAPADARAAEHAVADAYRRCDQRLAALPGAVACASGCSWCCHQPVAVTAAEAIALADALREAFPADWLARVRGAVALGAARAAGSADAGAYRDQRIACAFLAADGACAVYAWRPIVCRGHRSRSSEACIDELDDWRRGNPAHDRPAHALGNAVLEGMRGGFVAAGRDATLYELHNAVLRALDTPDAALRWARGEDVFAGCLARLA